MTSGTILITGGAGYLGYHTALVLKDAGNHDHDQEFSRKFLI